MKQYFVNIAHGLNSRLVTVNDGKIESNKVVSDFELIRLTEELEANGYREAYFVDEFKERLEDAKEKVKQAEEDYQRALANPLKISKEDAKWFFPSYAH